MEEVKPFRGHRRVKSSSARLPSLTEIQSTGGRNDEQSPYDYAIPYLGSTNEKKSHQESLFSDFANSRMDRLRLMQPHSLSRSGKSMITRATSLNLAEEAMPSPTVDAYKMKKSQTFVSSSFEGVSVTLDRSFDISNMKQWALDLKNNHMSFSSHSDDRNILSLGSDDEDTIEIFRSDEVVKEDIRGRKKKKKTWQKRRNKRENKQRPSTKESKENIAKPGWIHRGKSDSSESKRSQESRQEIETRRNLISKIQRLRFSGNASKGPTSIPLHVSHCAEEDISTQSSTSDNLENRGFQKRNCFTSFVGIKSVDMETSMKRNCFNSLKGSQYVSESFSSGDSNKSKTNINVDFHSQSNTLADTTRSKTPDTRHKSMDKNPKLIKVSGLKPKLNVCVTPKKNGSNTAPLSPSEPFDPNSIDVPDSILTSQDDDNHSVASNTSSSVFSFASSHFSQSQTVPSTPTTPSSRSLASTPRYNVVQVGQTPDKLLASEFENGGYASDCASTCSQSSILSTSTYSSVYTDASSIRDPCAKKSNRVKRSKKLRAIGGDGDVWIEKVFVSRKSGKKRIYFVSIKTGERVRGEPPSGASHVLYMADLVHRQGAKSNSEPENIIICK